MKTLLNCTILILCIACQSLSQGKEETSCDDGCVDVIRSLVKAQKTGFSTSWLEKNNRNLGDRIGVGLQRIFSKKEISNSDNIRLFLPIIREAFADPKMIRVERLRSPVRTLQLLKRVYDASENEDIRKQIETLMDCLENEFRDCNRPEG